LLRAVVRQVSVPLPGVRRSPAARVLVHEEPYLRVDRRRPPSVSQPPSCTCRRASDGHRFGCADSPLTYAPSEYDPSEQPWPRGGSPTSLGASRQNEGCSRRLDLANHGMGRLGRADRSSVSSANVPSQRGEASEVREVVGADEHRQHGAGEVPVLRLKWSPVSARGAMLIRSFLWSTVMRHQPPTCQSIVL